jgi:putative transcriptional regulator
MKPTRVRNAIRSLRAEHGRMTQRSLAQQIGVTRQTLIAIEAGKHSPSLETAFRIAAVFGVPLEAVFRYEPAETASGDNQRDALTRPQR